MTPFPLPLFLAVVIEPAIDTLYRWEISEMDKEYDNTHIFELFHCLTIEILVTEFTDESGHNPLLNPLALATFQFLEGTVLGGVAR